ncbi:MAG: PmoA family protein [Planctomycetota bacterium]
MTRSVRRARFAGVAIPALVSGALFAGEAYRIEVRAGPHARKGTPVRFELPGGRDASGEWRLAAEGGAEVAVQADLPPLGEAKPRAVVWILEEPLPAGGVRRYSLEREKGRGFPDRVVVAEPSPGRLAFRFGGRDAFVYNERVVEPPPKVEAIFARSGYIHPLFSPSGRLLSDDFPLNHKHHHGLWLTWSQTVFEGLPTNFWEQARGEGKVDCAGVDLKVTGPVFGAVRARHVFTALKGSGGPKPAMREVWDVRLWAVEGGRAIDFVSVLETAGESPVLFKEYRYGGLGFRGSAQWDVLGRVEFLSSEGKKREDGNATTARWCDMFGKVDGALAGIAFLSDPRNFRFPQGMRIHPTEPFFNFAPCQGGDFTLEPGTPLVSRYRLFVHEGALEPAELERLWHDYAEPPEVRVVEKGPESRKS